MKPKIVINHWEETCEDDSCYEYGTSILVNGKELVREASIMTAVFAEKSGLVLQGMTGLEQLQAEGRKFVDAGIAPPEMLQQFDEAIALANRFLELSRACNAPPSAAHEDE